MYSSRLRPAARHLHALLPKRTTAAAAATFTTTTVARQSPLADAEAKPTPPASATTATTAHTQTAPQTTEDARAVAVSQAPNRAEVWSRSQRPRAVAMAGPRFEQTDFEVQPRPWAAIELIHQQPVRWTHDRIVACDGGGGAAGHPKIYINTDKPEIATCNYCGLPFANEHHREHLESLPETSYPLSG